MPIIQTFDPLTAASEAIGAYSDRKRKNELDAQAKAYTEKRDARADFVADRAYQDSHAQTMSAIQTEKQNRDIASATEEYNQKLRPLQLRQQDMQLQIQQGTLDAQKAQSKIAALDLEMKTVDKIIKTKYGVQTAAAALQKSQAEATTAQVTAANAPQTYIDQHAQNVAAIASTKAATDETRHRIASGYDDPHASRGTATERETSAYNGSLGALSDTGKKFYEMLYSSNNPPTRAQAMLALHATFAGGTTMTKDDKKNLETLIDSHESQFVSPTAQGAAARSDARGASTDANRARTDRERAYQDVTKGPAFLTLPPKLREMIRHVMVDQGLSVQQALEQLPRAPIDDASKQAITRALSSN